MKEAVPDYAAKESISDHEMYLYLSFIPRFREASVEWFFPNPREEFGHQFKDESWWIAEGIGAFKKTIVDELSRTPDNATHVVYLSGGLDSRIILGGLLENLPTSQIVAATYGIPGSWDWEVASAMAKKFGLRHEVFDLTDDKWDLDQLVESGRRLERPISVHQSYVRQKITNYFGEEYFYWSGLMGDALLGAKMPKVPHVDKRDAIEKLFLKSLATKNYGDELLREQVISQMISECPWDELAKSKLTLDQQLLLGIWVPQLTRPTLMFNGFNFVTPFLNTCWVNFCLNVPYNMLVDQHLYRRIIQAGFSKLAKFPVTTTAGMSLMASPYDVYLGKVIAKIKPYLFRRDQYFSHPRTNYINWAESLRHKGPFQDMMSTTIECLKKRRIFDAEEIDAWWNVHQSRQKDYAFLLMNLSSLELFFQAGVLIP